MSKVYGFQGFDDGRVFIKSMGSRGLPVKDDLNCKNLNVEFIITGKDDSKVRVLLTQEIVDGKIVWNYSSSVLNAPEGSKPWPVRKSEKTLRSPASLEIETDNSAKLVYNPIQLTK